MCQISERIPLLGDDEEVQVLVTNAGAVLRLTATDGSERDVALPMRKVAERPAMRGLGALAGVLVAFLASGCEPVQDADRAGRAVAPSVSVEMPDASPDAVPAPAEDAQVVDVTAEADSVPAVPDVLPVAAPLPVTDDCRVILIANVYQPGTDRLSAPLNGVPKESVVVYLDNAAVDRASWFLADDGHTLVVTHCFGGSHIVTVSIGCTATGLDCSAAYGCRQ